ncbi:hypothetical protein IPA_03195 [Ignicoccus pacificus DSM 13166]|uniref:DUF5615 domain-containing protein n=1 Tax=Ignicoccus pacificus DSM 13166 TaxID=940294 RepID=A0A977KB00_9CREN|nr:hypothetical protein IPA_03195 [Ignicoccus pacificus DSM 13166]
MFLLKDLWVLSLFIIADINMIGFGRWLRKRLRYIAPSMNVIECYNLIKECNDEDLIYLAYSEGALVLTWDRDFPDEVALRPPERFRGRKYYYKHLWGWFWKELKRRKVKVPIYNMV